MDLQQAQWDILFNVTWPIFAVVIGIVLGTVLVRLIMKIIEYGIGDPPYHNKSDIRILIDGISKLLSGKGHIHPDHYHNHIED